MRSLSGAAFCIALLAVPTGVMAQLGDIYLRLGPVGVWYQESAEVSVAGADVSGADIDASDNIAATIDIGYKPLPFLSATLTLGIPPRTTLTGNDALMGQQLGKVRAGPITLAAQGRLPLPLGISPYLGLGLGYVVVFSTQDGFVRDLEVDNGFAPVFQLGVDWLIPGTPFGAYLDAKFMLLTLESKGSVFLSPDATSGIPTEASLIANPLILGLGAIYQF